MQLATDQSLTTLELGRLLQRLRQRDIGCNEEQAIGVANLVCESPAEFIRLLYGGEEFGHAAVEYLKHKKEEWDGVNVGKAYGRGR